MLKTPREMARHFEYKVIASRFIPLLKRGIITSACKNGIVHSVFQLLYQVAGLVQGRRNPSALAMKLRFSALTHQCDVGTTPGICITWTVSLDA